MAKDKRLAGKTGPNVALACDVSSDGVPCPRPATHFFIIPEGSRMYQGQEPSPRCEFHKEQAARVFTEALCSYRLVNIATGEEE